MASTITGVNGAVTFPANVGPQEDVDLHVFEWHATITSDVFEDSNFSQTDNYRRKVRGMYHLTGTARGTVVNQSTGATETSWGDATNGLAAENAGPVAGFVLTAQSGDTYTFNGIVSNVNYTTNKTDRAFMTITFESSGEVVAAA